MTTIDIENCWSEITEAIIRTWPANDLPGLMAFIKPLWRYDYWSETGGVYYISTGGYSGNEYIISAMQSNFVWWMMFWCQSTRGGHYVFAAGKDWIEREL